MKWIKLVLIGLTLLSIACQTVQAEPNKYMVMWQGGIEAATMEEIADMEEAMNIMFGEGKAYIIYLSVLPDDYETGEQQLDIPEQQDI